METIHCPYCHEQIDSAAYPEHEAEHLALRTDGQHNEYVTLAPDDRDEGSLEGVPQVYEHLKCGTCTGMPEEIIRSYLKNPYLYGADATYCCGCETHVPLRECVWTETGEDLQTYTDKLRAAVPQIKSPVKSRSYLGWIILILGLIAAAIRLALN